MTKQQFEQLFGLVTKGVYGVQRLENKVSELGTRVSRVETGMGKVKAGQERLELGQSKLEDRQLKLEKGQSKLEKGQSKIEKELRINNTMIGNAIKDFSRLTARVGILEQQAS